MKKQGIAIGVSDFKSIIDENCYLIDKSLLIKEIIDDKSGVILIPRPRRFGKTLNMMMLRYFFEKTEESNKYLFQNLEISKHSEYMHLQGEYPVIYLTFKGTKYNSWEKCYKELIRIIVDEYRKHSYLLDSSILKEIEKKNMN